MCLYLLSCSFHLCTLSLVPVCICFHRCSSSMLLAVWLAPGYCLILFDSVGPLLSYLLFGAGRVGQQICPLLEILKGLSCGVTKRGFCFYMIARVELDRSMD